jgi:hypothetical protein
MARAFPQVFEPRDIHAFELASQMAYHWNTMNYTLNPAERDSHYALFRNFENQIYWNYQNSESQV